MIETELVLQLIEKGSDANTRDFKQHQCQVYEVLGQFGVYVNHEETIKFNVLVITVALETMQVIKIWVKKNANINFHDNPKHGTAFGGWERQRVLFIAWQTRELLLTLHCL